MASVLHSHDAVDKLANSVDNLKISALVNAAKISPHVQQRTIGPKSKLDNQSQSNKSNDCIDSLSDKNSNNKINCQVNDSGKNGKFHKDVWREVNVYSETDELPKNQLQFNDYKAIKFRLAVSNAEKQRRAKSSTDLQEKQCQLADELDQRLQKIRIDSAEKQKQNRAKRLEREQQALKAIETIEAQAKQDEIQTNAKKSEMIEHSRKLIERANQLKRQDEIRLLIESINACKVLFINLFELYAKTIINHQTLLNQTGKLAEFTAIRDSLLQRYEKIINLVNTKSITMAETHLFEKLCADIKSEQNELNQFIQISSEAARQNGTATAAAAATANANDAQIATEFNKNAGEELNAANAHEISVIDGVASKPSIPSIGSAKNVGTEDCINKYYELINYYKQYEAHIQPLIADVNAKKFRFNCQKGVNTPVNSIAAVSGQHLQEKCDKISDLLSGNRVYIGDVPFTAAEHPLGTKYCTFLLAKKFITQGTNVTSSHASAAFPIAAIIVSIWQLYPDVGKLFLALLYIECPFLVPYFLPQKPEQSEIEYFSSLGYRLIDGKMEEQEQYLKRIAGLQRLYSAVLITNLKRNQQNIEHPHDLGHGWIWLTNFLMLDPLPGISPTLLLEFLQICGANMWQVYKKQFIKLLLVLHHQYISKLDKVDGGGPYARLKEFVGTIVKENRIAPPTGTLPSNFW